MLDVLESAFAEVRAMADAEKAASMSAYMRDQFTFAGVTSPDRRRVSKDAIRAARSADPDVLIEAAERCWAQPEREFQQLGTELLRSGAGNLRAHDLLAIRRLIQTKSWWDTIDLLAAWVVGPMVTNHPTLADDMDEWIDDPDFWIARAAILHQLGYKERTDADRLFSYAEKRAADTQFFIRKALGWSLRQYARTDPDAVRDFVEAHEHELSGLTRREALKGVDRG